MSSSTLASGAPAGHPAGVGAASAPQRLVRIAYLGPEGTFTQLAAQTAARERFGGDVEYLPCRSIGQVFEAAERGQADYGVVPVENSSDGSVLQTLDLFMDTPLQISSEVLLWITQNLIGRGPITAVKRVYSKDTAIAQCRNWLDANLPHVETAETPSTTIAAERAAHEEGAAAIASEQAAAEYGLQVLARAIQDQAHNATRFVLLGKEMAPRSGNDKTSMLFAVHDRAGALFDVLAVFAARGINLTRIESRPSKRQAWEYVFFVDLAGHPNDPPVAEALAAMREACTTVKVLGAWPVERRAGAPPESAT